MCFALQSQKGPIEVYLCPEDVGQDQNNTTTGSTASTDSACSNGSGSSSDDSFFSEDSTSCDSFKGKFTCTKENTVGCRYESRCRNHMCVLWQDTSLLSMMIDGILSHCLFFYH